MRPWLLCLLCLLVLAVGCSSDNAVAPADAGRDASPADAVGDASAELDPDVGPEPDLGPPPPAPWPEWVLHHWVWEDESTDESAQALVDGYLAREIPVGALIIDSPWATGYNTFDVDTARFADLAAFVDGMHSKDVRVLLWIVPAINTDVTPLYQEAADKGYLMQKKADSGPAVVEWWKGQGSLLDYFNPAALDWWHALVDKALALEIDGWKCDGLDFQALFNNYSPGLGATVSRPEYSAAYYRDFFDYTRDKLGDDRVIMARPVDNYGAPVGGPDVAFAPREINFAGWVGDQDATFAGLRAALLNLWYSAELGYVIIGSDIGGYRDDDAYPQGRSKEVFIRWAQLGAFCPLMENGGSGDHHPWAWDDETVAIYRTQVLLHEALVPYLMNHGARAHVAGESLMKFLDQRIDYHYLLGPEIFVSPILESGGGKEVRFPEGSRWVYLYDPTKVYDGGAIEELTFPLDEYPVFIREGAAVLDTLRAALKQ